MKINYQQYSDDCIKRIVIDDKAQSFEKLSPNTYKPTVNMIGEIFYNTNKDIDKLIKLRGGILNNILKKIESFISEETISKYKEMGIGHKMGLLFYGPQGTGKTCTAKMLIKQLIDTKDTICLDFTGSKTYLIKYIIKDLRKIQDNLIIIFVDEIDASFREEEENWLALLDGTDSFDNCIIMGCTNNFEKIPERIKDRPSRIKYVYEIKAFPDVVYRQYIKDKLPSISDSDLNKAAFLAAENSLTLDQVKHLLIDFYIEGISIETNIESIKKEKPTKKRTEEEEN